MSTPAERLQHSLAEFWAMLDCMHFTGDSQVVEVQRLKVLIDRYPDRARYFLAKLDRTATSADRDAGSMPEAQRLWEDNGESTPDRMGV